MFSNAWCFFIILGHGGGLKFGNTCLRPTQTRLYNKCKHVHPTEIILIHLPQSQLSTPMMRLAVQLLQHFSLNQTSKSALRLFRSSPSCGFDPEVEHHKCVMCTKSPATKQDGGINMVSARGKHTCLWANKVQQQQMPVKQPVFVPALTTLCLIS